MQQVACREYSGKGFLLIFWQEKFYSGGRKAFFGDLSFVFSVACVWRWKKSRLVICRVANFLSRGQRAHLGIVASRDVATNA